VKLTGPFYEIALVGDIIVVVVRARCDDDLNLIYGVDQTGEVVWRIQTPDYAEKIGGVEPYAGVSLRDGRLVARDVLGRLFAVDPKTGHIIGGMLGVTR
jgi:outer membrane protein assembly factor BamB